MPHHAPRYTRHGHIIIDTTPGANRYARFDDPNDATYECGQLNAQTGADSNNGRGLHWVEGAPRYLTAAHYVYDTMGRAWLSTDSPRTAQSTADFYNTFMSRGVGRHEWRDTP